MPFIEIDSVVKRYDDHVALSAIDLSIEKGEFVCLLGPSGCGKTTLMRSIAGLESIEGGTITVDGQLFSAHGYTRPPEQRKLGMVFQSYALWPHMTVFKNIAYTLKTNGWPKERIAIRVAEVLDLVGLHALEDRYPGQLSGGQMQRVALARSVAPEPRLLLFDEPLSNLDSKLREKMRFELRQIQQRLGITAIYVTHDQSEAMAVADRIALMNDGRVLQVGAAVDLYHTPSSLFAAEFMGTTNFVEADVVSVGTERCEFGWPSKVVVGGNLPESLHGATRVMTAVRPEHVKVRSTSIVPKPNSSVLPGQLDELRYLGNLSDVYVRVGETRLRSQMTPDQVEGWTAGMPVWVELETRWVRGVEELDASLDSRDGAADIVAEDLSAAGGGGSARSGQGGGTR